ncbi:MAG: tRNA (uridine(34)/cytosine(34)/5-carboxymethylaminomethyluridine(34)-2'-O)-methyltransferase TrmL [Cellulosilyticaceae bacterium]
MNIVLHEPEIPQNTGNIARTCAATGATLHLIEPLGFSLDEKNVKRAGLDYWHLLDLRTYKSFEEFLEKNNNPTIFMATTKSKQTYVDVTYDEDAYIMFGKESAGIPEEILLNYKETCVRIPMLSEARSLNLSNSVSIVLYEALRQTSFNALLKEGQLHHYEW